MYRLTHFIPLDGQTAAACSAFVAISIPVGPQIAPIHFLLSMGPVPARRGHLTRLGRDAQTPITRRVKCRGEIDGTTMAAGTPLPNNAGHSSGAASPTTTRHRTGAIGTGIGSHRPRIAGARVYRCG